MRKTTVAILDYGLGNLRSVRRGLERAGASTCVTSDTEEIMASDGVVMPGVGAFSEGMEQLGEMRETLMEYVQARPVLGICLGMQMLLESSEENGLHEGLALVPGRVLGFKGVPGMKVPHMGWNTIQITQESPLFEGVPEGAYLYFVHSYYAAAPAANTLTSTDYICQFSSAVVNGNAYGVQFHPEKSGSAGLKVLENFIGML